jgi:SAM-dependent methyltransferase
MSVSKDASCSVKELVAKRNSRWRRWLEPPLPLIHNPADLVDHPPLGRHNLYIGGAGSRVNGFINLDLFPMPGVDVVADAERLPFLSNVFARVECVAVLEHTPRPEVLVGEIARCLEPGGWAHLVAPFCHPFHEYPRDFYRFSPDGLAQLASPLRIDRTGWQTGPTATLLVFLIEYAKLWLSWSRGRQLVHFILGWALFPLRYLDLLLFKRKSARQIGNHCYLWAQKPPDA